MISTMFGCVVIATLCPDYCPSGTPSPPGNGVRETSADGLKHACIMHACPTFRSEKCPTTFTTSWFDEPNALASRCSSICQHSWPRSLPPRRSTTYSSELRTDRRVSCRRLTPSLLLRTNVLVVDASVIAPAIADGGPDGDACRMRIKGQSLAAPDLLRLETMSVLPGT